MVVLFKKTYSDESIGQDVGSDIQDLFAEHEYRSLPEDEHYWKRGTFTVTVTWEDDE